MPDTFDTTVAPFDRLDPAQTATLCKALNVAYYRQGDILLDAGQAAENLFVIIKGSVEERAADGGEVYAHYTHDDLFDVRAQLNPVAKHRYRALEDTLCYLLPKPVFTSLYRANQSFADYFDSNLSKRQQLFEEAQKQQNLAEFILTKIDDSNIQPALEVPHTASIREVTLQMKAQKLDCALVLLKDAPHRYGIVTRTNMLHALIADGLPPDTPAGDVATSPVISVEKGDFLFNAMIGMTRERVKRVQITENGKTAGMLDLTQVLSLFSTHSHVLTLQIARADTIEALGIAAGSQFQLVNTLINNGIHTRFVMDLISAVNEQIIEKAFRLTVPQAYQSRCCLLVMGSEGRGEQILKTDQDNALIMEDGLDWPGCPQVMEQLSHTLGLLGYPPCMGKVMVNNPKWIKSASSWAETVNKLCRSANETSLMDLAIFADSRAVAGNKALLEPVLETLHNRMKGNMLALNTFVRPALAFRVPLTLFGSLKTGKEGLDVKKGGIFPLVHGVRSLALESGLAETNTFDRLAALAKLKVLEQQTADNLVEALKLLIKLRLKQQLCGAGDISSQIDVATLSRTDRDLLRHALHIVKKFKEQLAFHYQVRD